MIKQHIERGLFYLNVAMDTLRAKGCNTPRITKVLFLSCVAHIVVALTCALIAGTSFACTAAPTFFSSLSLSLHDTLLSSTPSSLSLSNRVTTTIEHTKVGKLMVGAEQTSEYLHLLEGKRVGLVINQSARVRVDVLSHTRSTNPATDGDTYLHLLDALLAQKVDVKAVFSPEHGFRGGKGAGEKIDSSVDAKTGLPIHSLYGKTKKPTPDMLANIDVLIFDIQDVGVRFYTYLSTLHYVIEAAFEHNIDVVVLDRPNPNGKHVDGPVLESAFSSFVGMHPIPVLHGMTLGELALMMVGESWVEYSAATTSTLTVIPIAHYQRTMHYSLPVAPSPNLPTDLAVRIYPTLCFFEGTDVSVGRGTAFPFQLIGHPSIHLGNKKVEVNANAAARYPKHENQVLFSTVFETHNASANVETMDGIDIQLLINTYEAFRRQRDDGSAPTLFFTRPEFFDKLAGTNKLRKMIENGESAEAIRQSWALDLQKFKAQRRPYLLYQDVKNIN